MINSDNLLQKYRPEILPEIVEERILRAKKCFFDLPIKEYSLDNLESFFRARSNRFKNDSISYGFRLMGDEIDVDNFIQTLNRAIEILDFDFMINEVTEEKLLSDFDNVWSTVREGEILLIRDCKDEPMNEIESDTWKKIGKQFKNNPKICKILCLQNNDVVKNRFKSDEELYYRVFNSQIEFKRIDKETIPDLVINKLSKEGYIVKEEFIEELNTYVNKIYDKADYRGREFLEDLLDRIYREYNKKNRGKIIDEDCVPYYIKEDSTYYIKKYDDNNDKRGNIKSKNILILALSKFQLKEMETNEYTYIESDGKKQRVQGRYQLDPVPRKIFNDLIKNGEKIDEIVMLVTKEICETKVVKLKGNCAVRYENSNETGVTELDFFINEYNRYIDEYFKENFQNEQNSSHYYPVYKSIKWKGRDENNDENILETINEIIDEIRKNSGDDSRVFVDIHGGLRDLQQIIMSILSLLSLEGIEISPEDVYSVEVGKNIIVNAGGTIDIFNFVSGMNELIHYGRTNSFKRYKLSEREQNLIKILNNIAESIQLLRVNYFEENIKNLRKSINDIDSIKNERGYIGLFIDNIRNNYSEILRYNYSVIDEINWCMKMGFYQQALTLIESKIPKYLVDKKVIDYPEQVIIWGNKNKNKNEEIYNYIFNNLISKCVPKDSRIQYLIDNDYNIEPKIKIEGELLNKYFLKEIDINEKIHTFLKIHFALKELRNNSSHGGTLNLENKFGSEQLKIWIDKYMKAINDLDNRPYINVIRNNELFIFSGFLKKLEKGHINIDETIISIDGNEEYKNTTYGEKFRSFNIYNQMKEFVETLKRIDDKSQNNNYNLFADKKNEIVKRVIDNIYPKLEDKEKNNRYTNHKSNKGNTVKATSIILVDLQNEYEGGKSKAASYEFTERVYEEIKKYNI